MTIAVFCIFAISKFLLRAWFKKFLEVRISSQSLSRDIGRGGPVDKTASALDWGLSAAELRKGPSSAIDSEVCPNDVGRVICC